ncbi:MAG: purine-nucleoside phosphorylase [Sphaerochaetaceae bacterium]|nr:purine-nucleoside phosphorylase [Sphaerochaetaceae bacterium]
MSTHIAAKEGEIASRVLLPGDPLRAKFIAENFLENVKCYSTVRNMFGFTGTYKGKEVSVQGTGMGTPSQSIYVNELIQFYGAKRLIRTGTCGSTDPNLRIKDMAIIQAAATDSGMNHNRFGVHGLIYPPVADFNLLRDAVDAAARLGYPAKVTTCYSADQFYDERGEEKEKLLLKYGVSCVEMECSELFTLGARFGVQTLGILTVSDMIFEKEYASAFEREQTFTKMMEVALEAI